MPFSRRGFLFGLCAAPFAALAKPVYASGGFVSNSACGLIGEATTEAFVPLPYGRILELVEIDPDTEIGISA